MTTTIDCLRLMQRAELCLRRISDGDHKAMEAAPQIAEALGNEIHAAGLLLADEEEDDGAGGQDRENYTDTQDRKNYT